MKDPNHITSLELYRLLNTDKLINGKWQPARPVGCCSVFERITYALWVLLGKADVLTWPGQ